MAIKDHSPKKKDLPQEIISWLSYLTKVEKTQRPARLLSRKYPEDAKQIKKLIAVEVNQLKKYGISHKEIIKIIKALYREEAEKWAFKTIKDNDGQNVTSYLDTRIWSKNTGSDMEFANFNRPPKLGELSQIRSALPPEKEYPQCGVPGCSKKGTAAYDPKHGRLCHTCKARLIHRIKKGYQDPYKDLDKKPEYRLKNVKNHRLIKIREKDFWRLIQNNLPDTTWNQIWLWAKRSSESDVKEETLEEIRRKILAHIESLPHNERRYKKKYRDSTTTVFLDVACIECGEKYEIDVYEILLGKISFSGQCPDCSGVFSSKRLFRYQKVIKKYIAGTITSKEAEQQLGCHNSAFFKIVKRYKNKGLSGLAKSIDFPYFKISQKRVEERNIFKKVEKELASSLDPNKFI